MCKLLPTQNLLNEAEEMRHITNEQKFVGKQPSSMHFWKYGIAKNDTQEQIYFSKVPLVWIQGSSGWNAMKVIESTNQVAAIFTELLRVDSFIHLSKAMDWW